MKFSNYFRAMLMAGITKEWIREFVKHHTIPSDNTTFYVDNLFFRFDSALEFSTSSDHFIDLLINGSTILIHRDNFEFFVFLY